MSTPVRPPSLTRRRALGGLATAGVGVPLLTACSGDDSTAGSTAGSTTGDPSTAPSTAGSTSASAEATPSEESSGGPGSDALAKAADVPVGSGLILPEEQLVLTQPTEGEFKCFTAVCTHQGCIVSSVQLGGIRCECHGSAFSIEDGSVINPPATRPLAEQPISVDQGRIRLA